MAGVSSAQLEQLRRAFAACPGTSWFRVNCPVCPDATGKADHKLSLGYNPKTGGFNCFKCGIRGRIHGGGVYDGPVIQNTRPFGHVEELVGFVELFSGPGLATPSNDRPRQYLVGRRLQQAALAEAGVGVATHGRVYDEKGEPVLRRLDGRVIVPVFAPDQNQVGWVGRDWTGRSTLPYRYASGMQREGLAILFNEVVLAEVTETPVFVVEGTLDAIALWPDAVAVLGKPLACQVEKLVGARRPVVVCLDGDAWQEGWALAMKLRFLGQRAGNIRLPPKVDPDEVPRAWLDEEARRALRSAG